MAENVVKWYQIPCNYLHGRRWTTLNYNGRYIPYYSISDRGEVFNHYLNIFSKRELTVMGYYRIRITPQFEKRNGVNYALHRAVLMSFEPIPNFNEMQVNHIDGNKLNDALWNLEWVTCKENIKHAHETGLRDYRGEKSPTSIHTDIEVHDICKLIVNGHNDYEIATIMGYPLGHPYRENYGDFVTNIRNGKAWTHISCQYEFYPDNKFNKYNDNNFLHTLCELLEHKYDYDSIITQLNINDHDKDNIKELLYRLDNRTIFPHITNLHDNLKEPLILKRLDYCKDHNPGLFYIDLVPGVYYCNYEKSEVKNLERGVRYIGRKLPHGVKYY